MNQHIELSGANAGKQSVGTLFDKTALPRMPRRPRQEPHTAPARHAGVVHGSIREAASDLALRAQAGRVRLEALDSYDWRKQLHDFLHTYGRTRSNDFTKPTSEETFRNRRDVLFSSFHDLMKDKQLKTLAQIKPRHLPRMFEIWTEKGIGKRAQINYYNHFRWFWRICGIEIEPIAHFAKEEGEFTINRNAEQDKSWAGNGVDFDQKYQQILEYDPIAARVFVSMKTYGLRLKEALCLRPHESDGGDHLLVLRGSKTGRKRQLEFSELDDANFRKLLDGLKEEVPEKAHLAWSNLTLAQAKRKMYSICRKFGITKAALGVSPHGLRHQFAIEHLEKLTGINAPVRGGVAINYHQLGDARRAISRALGHNRAKVTGAYYGSFISLEREQLREFVRSWNAIEKPMGDIGALLVETGADNLYWIGGKAVGARGAAAYEFVLPPGLNPEVSNRLCAEISETVLSATGVDCIVQPWESLPGVKQALWESESIPLFRAVSPLEYMKDRLEVQRSSRLKGSPLDDEDQTMEVL